MKKFFVLALCMLFVLGMAAFAFATSGGQEETSAKGSVSISGDARVRGVYLKDHDMNNDAAANRNNDVDNRYWDQRVRLKITGDVGSGIEVRTRLTTADDTWNGAANTGGSVNVDYAYLHIPVSGLIIDAGRMKRNWGNKLLVWDTSRDAFQVTANFGPVEVSAYTEKVTDTFATRGNENLHDFNNNALYVNYSADIAKAGLIYVYEDDDTPTQDDACGSNVSAYANVNAGPVAIASEVAYKGGGRNKDAQKKTPYAGFISATAKAGIVSVSGTYAVSKNTYTADTHFTPTVFIGTDNPTAISNFTSAANDATRAYILGVSVDATSTLSVSGKLAYMSLTNLGAELGGRDTGKEAATEVDLGIGYKLASNAKYLVDLGYWNPDDITTSGDNALSVSNKIEVSF